MGKRLDEQEVRRPWRSPDYHNTNDGPAKSKVCFLTFKLKSTPIPKLLWLNPCFYNLKFSNIKSLKGRGHRSKGFWIIYTLSPEATNCKPLVKKNLHVFKSYFLQYSEFHWKCTLYCHKHKMHKESKSIYYIYLSSAFLIHCIYSLSLLNKFFYKVSTLWTKV